MLKGNIKLLIVLLIIAASGCARQDVKFEGKVYEGFVDKDGLVTLLGPATTAEVWAESTPSVVVEVDDNGDYLLSLRAPFSIGSAPVKEYTLIATRGGSLGGADEKIIVKGVIGETNKVRDFLLYQHTEIHH